MQVADAVTYHQAAWLKTAFSDIVDRQCHDGQVAAVAELGGGARPMIGDDDRWGWIQERAVFDISAEEMARSGTHLVQHAADLCAPLDPEHFDSCDVVISRMLCEHLSDPSTFHRNVLGLLRPGGVAVHYFPTLYAAPFVLNRLAPERAAQRLVSVVQPQRTRSKFPAYYRWCAGPTRSTLDKYRAAGFEIDHWYAGFGHSYYSRVAPLDRLESAKSQLLEKRPVPSLTSFAIAVLRKPLAGQAA